MTSTEREEFIAICTDLRARSQRELQLRRCNSTDKRQNICPGHVEIEANEKTNTVVREEREDTLEDTTSVQSNPYAARFTKQINLNDNKLRTIQANIVV